MASPPPPKPLPLPQDDPLIILQKKLKSYKTFPQYYTWAMQLCTTIASLASIIRYHKGWSYENAGIWFNLCFWGGYMATIFIFGPIVVWGIIRDRRCLRDFREFEKERKRRGLEVVPLGGTGEGAGEKKAEIST